MEYRSFDDLSKVIIKNIEKIPKDIDLIIGIPRSGLLIANMLALILNKPLTDLKGYEQNRLISAGNTKNTNYFIKDCKQAKKVLVMEDSVDTGKSIIDCKNKIKNFASEDIEFIFGCVFINPGKEKLVDFYLEVVKQPRLFEWNIYHHSILQNSCCDIDGVLCVDPTNEENDNGANYLKFLNDAKSKIIPSNKIGALVTCRLKQYEKETREWLNNNNVIYDKLIMMNCTFEERIKNNNHGEFKGKYYKKSQYQLFIESDPFQAEIINKISHKPVYCVGNGMFYDGKMLYKISKENNFVQKIKGCLIKIDFVQNIYRVVKK